jgi:UDP-2-acetamido-2-deoxy-ribo-hexuluronate aminotransferase
MNIAMVDLKAQYQDIENDVNREILEVLQSTQFIGGPKVNAFRENLEAYLGVKHVIPCANGTDALQIAMMALGLQAGDEVIVPAFTYVATAEVIGLLGLTPVMTDVDLDTMNITAAHVEAAITPRTKAIVPVHLFGQSVDMEPILALAKKHNLWVIEDNAQAIGATYQGQHKTGTMGHFGCTSFFPSKNLGCYGDGGALMTNDDELAAAARIIANHGQTRQYYHDKIGVNSRLDALQAAILNVKLPHLDAYNTRRRQAADYYDAAFSAVPQLKVPTRQHNSTHVFHQYTLQIVKEHPSEDRDLLKAFLQERGIPAMIYYPVPLYAQKAFVHWWQGGTLPVTEQLCQSVFSLPMHSELTAETLQVITEAVQAFFQKK